MRKRARKRKRKRNREKQAHAHANVDVQIMCLASAGTDAQTFAVLTETMVIPLVKIGAKSVTRLAIAVAVPRAEADIGVSKVQMQRSPCTILNRNKRRNRIRNNTIKPSV